MTRKNLTNGLQNPEERFDETMQVLATEIENFEGRQNGAGQDLNKKFQDLEKTVNGTKQDLNHERMTRFIITNTLNLAIRELQQVTVNLTTS